MRVWLILGLWCCLVDPVAAALEPAAPTLVVITGIGGEPRFDERFHAWAATLMDAAAGRYGLADSQIVYLAADPQRDPGRARGRSGREEVRATLRDLASAMPPEAPLFVVIIGHGSFRGGVSKVNLPGPDMTAEDFAAALEPFGRRPILFANLTSASGEFLPRLSAPGRVVITASRSGRERNASVFAQHFVAAFLSDDADVDNDARLSILEAFNYARAEVERAYARDNKLLTEHAWLDDDGDGQGSDRPAAGDDGDGHLAASLTLGGTAAATAAAPGDPELARLAERKKSLEQGVHALRQRKAGLSREDYENQLEELLIELALANREIRQRREEGDEP